MEEQLRKEDIKRLFYFAKKTDERIAHLKAEIAVAEAELQTALQSLWVYGDDLYFLCGDAIYLVNKSDKGKYYLYFNRYVDATEVVTEESSNLKLNFAPGSGQAT